MLHPGFSDPEDLSTGSQHASLNAFFYKINNKPKLVLLMEGGLGGVDGLPSNMVLLTMETLLIFR